VATVVGSAFAGGLLSYLLPSRGPAALAVTGIMMIPMGISGYRNYQEGLKKVQEGGDMESAAHDLAKLAVGGLGDLALGFGGGWVGAGLGRKVAFSDTALGSASSEIQKTVIKGENKALIGLAKLPDMMSGNRPTLGGPEAMSIRPTEPLSSSDMVFAARS